MRIFLVILTLIAVAGCAAGPANKCDGFKPIYPASSDVGVLSNSMVQQVLEHNEFGYSLCGWRRTG